MRLDSARSLKAELLAEPLGRGAVFSRAVSEMNLIHRGARISPATRPQFALGIKGKKGNYKLALRIQESSPGLGVMIEQFCERCKGEVEVRNIGAVRKQQLWHRRRNRPLRIGGSIGPAAQMMAGTLGCFVAPAEGDLQDAQILSNNHVLADENRLRIGNDIVQQGRLDGGRRRLDVVGDLAAFERLRRRGNLIDAAVADIRIGESFYYNWMEGLGPINGVRTAPIEDGEIVYKIGRTTGLTEGRVSAIEVDQVRVKYDMGVIDFDGQIEIEPAEPRPFSLAGDSGSLIVDRQRRAMGLLFAGNDVDATFANPIGTVLSTMGLQLLF